MYFPGRTIIVAKELFITVLPKRDSWGRMLVWALLFPVHTLLHTPQWCRYSMHANTPLTEVLGFIFQGGHLHRGKKECSSNHSQSTPHAKAWRPPHKLPQLLHELIGTDSMVKPLTIQTNPNANVASLTLACFRLTSFQKTATMQLQSPYRNGEKETYSWKIRAWICHSAGKPPPPNAVKPRSLLAAAPSLAHAEQLKKSDQGLTSLTSNLPQVKIYFHSVLTFLYSRIWMNEAEKLTWNCDAKCPICKMWWHI